jgi:hypothetical protein
VGICFLNSRRHIIYSKSSPLLIDQIWKRNTLFIATEIK